MADGEYSDLKYFYDLVLALEDDGVVMTYDELKASGLHYSGAFAQGNIAMMPMGYWYVSTLNGYFNDGTLPASIGALPPFRTSRGSLRLLLWFPHRYLHQCQERQPGRRLDVCFVAVL